MSRVINGHQDNDHQRGEDISSNTARHKVPLSMVNTLRSPASSVFDASSHAIVDAGTPNSWSIVAIVVSTKCRSTKLHRWALPCKKDVIAAIRRVMEYMRGD